MSSTQGAWYFVVVDQQRSVRLCIVDLIDGSRFSCGESEFELSKSSWDEASQTLTVRLECVGEVPATPLDFGVVREQLHAHVIRVAAGRLQVAGAAIRNRSKMTKRGILRG